MLHTTFSRESALRLLRFCIFLVLLIGSAYFFAKNPQVTQASDVPRPAQAASPQTADTQAETGLVYYISPSGNDANAGTSEGSAWATFNRAWETLYPGDTLILLDGVYRQSLNPNKRNGEPGKPITIRAKNDGKAIIDGEYQRIPVKLGDTWPGPIGNYFVIEGIVARNSNDLVIMVTRAHHNIFRRVSAYNANTDTNSAVIGVLWPEAQYNLFEDCVAAGTGRKMVYTFQGQHNVFRRCFTYWQAWDGREWHDDWPWGDNLQVYNGSYNIIENSISYGPVPLWGISIQANHPDAKAIGNQVLGSIAIQAGMKEDGTPMVWGNTRPQPTTHTQIRDFNWPSQRAGIVLFGQGEMRDNLLQDVFAWGNAGLGLTVSPGTTYHPNNGNNQVHHATIVNNGLDNPDGPWPGRFGGKNTDVLQAELNWFTSAEDNYLENVFVSWPGYPSGARNLSPQKGAGARLDNRYVDGVLTNEPLWPWPMEDRIQAELGLGITEIMTTLIKEHTLPPTQTRTPTPSPSVTASPTVSPVPSATPVPTDETPMPAPEAMVRRVNAPRFEGTTIESERAAILWFGKVDATNNFANVRVGYNDEWLAITVHVFDRRLWYQTNAPTPAELADWDAVTLYLHLDGSQVAAPALTSHRFTAQLSAWEDRAAYQAAARGDGSNWVAASTAFTTTSAWRGNAPNENSTDDRGWLVTFRIPFASLGLDGAPQPTDVWRLALALHDRDQAAADNIPVQTWPENVDTNQPTSWGQLHFGQSVYQPPATSPSQLVTIRQGLDGVDVPDAHVGGHSTCGADSTTSGRWLWDDWGNINYGSTGEINIQNQWDIADWPCYSRYYVTFPLDSLPPNQAIISATLTMHLFGNAGYEEPLPSLIQVLTVADPWSEESLTWNNAPLAVENIASTWVNPVPGFFAGWPGTPYTWDISKAVADAYRTGQPVRLALYEADGQYHSGKYFSSSDTGDWNAVARPTLRIQLGSPTNANPALYDTNLYLPFVLR